MVEQESLPFSHHLRRLRETAGLTQAELAERAGLSVKAISALESGRRRRPYPSTVRALSDALGLSESERVEFTRATSAGSTSIAASSITASIPLPVPPTPIIGRERELTEVIDLLQDNTTRLITLTGPGGVGKTRLALEVAEQVRADVSSRASFVPLAPINDFSLVLPTIAQAIGLTETGDAGIRAMLLERLGTQPWLLVLDNLEHILDVAPDLAELLAACPQLTMLVTTRAPLRIRAEHEFPVRPLALPDLSRIPTPEEVENVSSVQLFLERARAAVPGFELTQANCAAVAAICRRLDGLPLALELVAARIRAMSPIELLARLDHVLPLLAGGSRDMPQRQQTMQAAINWSYQLLESGQQALFRRLSVFHGGWSLEAAEAVAGWGEILAADVVDLLMDLVEQSLVIAEVTAAESTRYRMLEPIRQFAEQHVEEAGETVSIGDRHLDWSLSLAQRSATEIIGPAQQEWLERLEREHDNMRAAMAWSELDRSRAERGLRLATALWRFWETRGHLTEGRRWLEHALEAADDVPAATRADALNAAGNLAHDQGESERAAALIEESLQLRREIGDIEGMAKSLNDLGNIILNQGDYQSAVSYYEEALSHFREAATEWGAAIPLNNLGIVLGQCGDYGRATELLEEALDIWERLGETAFRARALDGLGEIARMQGNLDRAQELHQTSLALRQELGDPRGIAVTLNNLGLVARYRREYGEAVRLIKQSLEIRSTIGIAVAWATRWPRWPIWHICKGNSNGHGRYTSRPSTFVGKEGSTLGMRIVFSGWRPSQAQKAITHERPGCSARVKWCERP
ncbi:hypothetical protein BH23CHL2_BH23CHL2_11880 [soil metagenome]